MCGLDTCALLVEISIEAISWEEKGHLAESIKKEYNEHNLKSAILLP